MSRINLFIGTTTYGQTFSCMFDLEKEGSLKEKRLTPVSDCVVVEPIYEKAISAEKIAQYAATGDTKKITSLGKALETENMRVNSLYALYNQLVIVKEMGEEAGVVVAYVPNALLQELQLGKYKFALYSDVESNYYSMDELVLWEKITPLLQELYPRMIYKDFANCKNNRSGSEMQNHRVNIYTSMYTKLLAAFKIMKDSKKVLPVSSQESDAFC